MYSYTVRENISFTIIARTGKEREDLVMDMGKKRKIIIAPAVGLGLLIAGFAYLMQIRGEFKDYLSEKYPEQTFQVGFVKIDPIYGSYFTTASCLGDEV